MPAAVWEMSELDKTTESKPNPEISAITAMIRFIGCNTWLFSVCLLKVLSIFSCENYFINDFVQIIFHCFKAVISSELILP